MSQKTTKKSLTAFVLSQDMTQIAFIFLRRVNNSYQIYSCQIFWNYQGLFFFFLFAKFCIMKCTADSKCYKSLHFSIMLRSDLFVEFMTLWGGDIWRP